MSLKKSLAGLSNIFSGNPKPLTKEQKEKAQKYLNNVNKEVNIEITKSGLDIIESRGPTAAKMASLKQRQGKLGGKSRRQRQRRNKRTQKRSCARR